MNDTNNERKKRLAWNEEGCKQVFECNVFSVCESYCRAPESQHNNGKLQTFSVIDARDWVITIPVIESQKEKQFVMVWQWRHGSHTLSLEFPGGVSEPKENPEDAAVRELYEETGYKPGKITKLGEFNPNPAIMSNMVHIFLAEDLCDNGKQVLDENEYVEVALVDTKEVIQGMGKEPYVHALMGAALSLYQQKTVLF
jgi:8-oxo-dGTP pyrophosphatase MutT (NUDIX family)